MDTAKKEGLLSLLYMDTAGTPKQAEALTCGAFQRREVAKVLN